MMEKGRFHLKNLNFKQMKKGTKCMAIGAAAVVVVGIGLAVYLGVSGSAAQAGAGSDDPQFDVITTGDISLTVSGSGNLTSAETLAVQANGTIVVDDVLVSAGDTIDVNQPIATLDTQAMQANADDLQDQIYVQQISIDTTNNVTTSLSIKSPADGWVKNVLLSEDDEIQTAMNEHGYVALVATQEREIINASEQGLAEGDTVTVKCEGYSYDGIVTNENGTLYVSIDTLSRTVGAQAAVYDTEGNEIFTGLIELAAYEKVTSSYGIITDVAFNDGDEIEAGETIYKATQYSQDVKEMYAKLEDLNEDYETMVAYIEAGQLLAPASGVVSEVTVQDGQMCEDGTILMSIESTDVWIAQVSVDELDINAIEVGQNVDVELDSLPNEVFEGIVTSISDMGTATGGITTYSVGVSIKDNEKFKLNMTLNCEIKAQEATGAVLLPVDDLRTSGNKSYVMVKVERSDADKSAITKLIGNNDWPSLAQYMGADAQTLGISILSDPTELLYAEVRAVETGIENAYYIEITQGLSEGESVLKPISGEEVDNIFGFPMDMGAMQGMGGPQMDAPQMGGPQMGGGRPDNFGGRPIGN